MRFIIKQFGETGETWLVRMSSRPVWGARERAKIFINRRSSEICAKAIQCTGQVTVELADSASGAADGSTDLAAAALIPRPAVSVELDDGFDLSVIVG